MIVDTVGKVPDEPGGLGKYYVSSTGNDSNSGTSPEQAWQTIEKVNRINFEPGDQVLFEGGRVFNGTIFFDSNDTGNAGNYVKIGSFGTGRATINAANESGFMASSGNFLSVENLNFVGSGRKSGNTGNGLIFSSCSDVVIDSVEVSGFQHSGIKIKNEGKNYRLNYLNAHDNGYAGIYLAGITKTSITNIYIGHSKTDNNAGDPTVLDNHSGNGIFIFNTTNILIEFCEASNNGWDMPRTGNGPGGIWVAEADSAIIQNCISHSNKTSKGGQDGLGFDLDGGTTNSVIQYCLSYNNQGAGYGIFQYPGASEWKNNVVRYCISENDGNVSSTANILFWNGSGDRNKFQGLEFYNNVVYDSNGPVLSFMDHSNLNFNFRNNIFVSKTNGVYNYINGENFQGNCWFPLDNNYFLNNVNEFYSWALASNQELLNGEIVGMFADPKLINPGKSNLTDPEKLTEITDYKTEEGSPVIDAGIDLKTLFNIDPGTRDFFGNKIKFGDAFDMGVYEYDVIPKILNKISFNSGWNIFSLPGNPDSTDLQFIVQPLIDQGTLIKIQDENGNSLENWGIFGGWQNNIGDVSLIEGYKIKVNENDSIMITGTQVQYPFAIPLHAGWNIAGYPQQVEFDGMAVVQQLIDRGVLEKVQDGSGNSIEDWGIFGGWQNNIGNFTAGKGYKIKVNADDTLWIYAIYPKSQTIQSKQIVPVHFTLQFKGNGVDYMNINIVDLPVNVFQVGDELAVFDGEICVGSVILNVMNLQNKTVSIKASATDLQGMPGFMDGNPFTVKLWNSKQDKEYILDPDILKGSSTFSRNETTFASLAKYASKGINFNQSGEIEIKCYPNPFKDEITTELFLFEEAKVSVGVLNQLGQKVASIVPKTVMNSGKHLFKWNGTDSANRKISSGIYFFRVTIDDEIYFKKIVYN